MPTTITGPDGQQYVVDGNSLSPVPVNTGLPPGMNDTSGMSQPAPAGGTDYGALFDRGVRAVKDYASASMPGASPMGLANAVLPGVGAVVKAGQDIFGGAPNSTPPSTPPSTSVVPAAPGATPSPTAAPPPAPAPAQPSPAVVPGAPPSGGGGTAQFDKDTKAATDAAKATGEAEGKAKAAVGNAQAEQAKAQVDAGQHVQAAGDAAYQQEMGRYQDVMDAISNTGKAAAQYDPNRWWKSRTEGQKVLGVIGLALGAVAEGLGGKNAAADMIAAQIARDNDAQKFRIEQLGHTAKAKEGLLGHFMQITGNHQLALKASMAYQLDAAATKVLSVTSQSQSPVEVQKGIQTATELKQKSDIYKSELQTAAQARANSAAAAAREKSMFDYQRAQLTNPNRPLQDGEVDVGGQRFNVGEKSFQQIRAAQTTGDKMREAISTMREELRKPGSWSEKTAPGSRYAAAYDTFNVLSNKSEDVQAVEGEQQRKLYDEALKPGLVRPDASVDAALQQFDKNITNGVNILHRRTRLPDYYAAPPSGARPGVL